MDTYGGYLSCKLHNEVMFTLHNSGCKPLTVDIMLKKKKKTITMNSILPLDVNTMLDYTTEVLRIID